MEPLGRQVTADAYGCHTGALNDAERLRELLRLAAAAAGARVLAVQVHAFQPQGLTGLAMLSTSHLAVHTWPEHGYAAVDVFTCGGSDPWAAVEVLLVGLGARRARLQEWPRGGGHAWAPAPREVRRLTRFYAPSSPLPGATPGRDTAGDPGPTSDW